MPLTVKRIRGIAGDAEYFLPQTRSSSGGYEYAGDLFDDEPAITCELWPGDDLPVAGTLPATWYINGDGLRGVNVEFPAATMATLELGWYDGLVTVVGTGKPVVGFKLETTPSPGSGVRRPVYHAYKDLLDEAPWIRRLADDAYDQIGFAEASADARDWLDAAILDSVRDALRAGQIRSTTTVDCSNPTSTYSTDVAEYADALAADALVLDTPDGRRLFKATVYKALAIILNRAVGLASSPADLMDKSKDYEAKAEAMLASSRLIAITGLSYVPLNLVTVGRVTR